MDEAQLKSEGEMEEETVLRHRQTFQEVRCEVEGTRKGGIGV